jgi:hypothetical protein
MTMLVRIYHDGRVYVIEAPANARVVQTSGEDCLVYRWNGRTEYLLTPFVLMYARQGARGLRLVRETAAKA